MTDAVDSREKKCSSCGERLPLAAFNRVTKSADGHAAICRPCASAAKKRRRPTGDRSEIRAAIRTGNLVRFQALLSGSPFAVDELLAIAVQDYNTAKKHTGHVEIVDFLLSRGATPDAGIIFEATRAGNEAVVDRLVAGGAEMDVFACAAIGDTKRLKRLLDRGPHLARARTSQAIADYRNLTPLHLCCLSALGRESPERERWLVHAGRLLVENGAEIDATGTFFGSLVVTPLDLAAHSGGNLPLIRFLLDDGVNVTSFAFANALAHRGRSLESGFELAELFLQYGYEIDAAYKDGAVLHTAANSGVPEVVRWLLEHGADVNARGRLGRTPLHLAAERNVSTRVDEVLDEYGADLSAKDDLGMDALTVAEQHGKTVVASWLRNRMTRTPE